MYRLKLFLVAFLFCFLGRSEGLRIITSDGLQGIANSDGKVVIPPIYEFLGWSNGTNNILDESIGYRENGKWGLINIKNKKITNARYCLLKPFSEEVIEAGILGRFSNMVFRGLIDSSANNVLDFRYFSIQDVGGHRLIVSEFTEGRIKYGVFTDSNQRVIPVQFKSAKRLGDVLVLSNESSKVRPYDLNGNPLLPYWVDKIATNDAGYLIENEGYFGQLDANGNEILPIQYKRIENSRSTRFPKWEVRSLANDDTRTISCDSLSYDDKGDLLIAHVNNAEHILAASKSLFENQQHKLVYVGNGYLVTTSNLTGKWGIYKTNGEEVVSKLDSVSVDSMYFYAKTENTWQIYNFFGRKLNQWPLEAVSTSQQGYIPIKKNGYWGWVDFQGNRIMDNKFDAVLTTLNQNQLIVKYLDKWGVNTFSGKWVIMPSYDSIASYGNFYLAKNASATYIISNEGVVLDKTAYQITVDDFLRLVDGAKHGAITKKGVIVDPVYDDVSLIDNYLKLRQGNFMTLMGQNGEIIVEPEDKIQDVFAFAEGYFHILKDGKHGFVDENGMLRIANRYDGAQPFSEDLAPVQLMGKWGFITKSEKLIIQPFYGNSSTFKNDLAIVQNGQNYGLINKKGDEIIKPVWKAIERLPTGSYVITDWDDKKGIANENGRFIVRPTYEDIADTNQRLFIATREGKKGVLNYSGMKTVNFEYEDIKIVGDYMLLRKAE